MRRRRILLGAGTIFVTAVAGCLTDEGPDEVEDSPTDAVEQYLLALADGDHERANQHAHSEGDYHVDDDSNPFPTSDLRGLTIDETEVVDVEEAIRYVYEQPEEERIDRVVEEEKAALEELQDEYGFGEYAYVHIQGETEVTGVDLVFVLFEDDDEWIIWSDPTFSRGS